MYFHGRQWSNAGFVEYVQRSIPFLYQAEPTAYLTVYKGQENHPTVSNHSLSRQSPSTTAYSSVVDSPRMAKRTAWRHTPQGGALDLCDVTYQDRKTVRIGALHSAG